MTVAKDHVIEVFYTLKDSNGETIDTNVGDESLAYIHGHGMMIPGFEKALEGKKGGEKAAFTVAPEDGYGHRNEEAVFDIPRETFPEDDDLQEGHQVVGQTPDGQQQMFRILEVNDETVKLDGNHPLADQELHFEVEIVSIRLATAEEIDHGHVH